MEKQVRDQRGCEGESDKGEVGGRRKRQFSDHSLTQQGPDNSGSTLVATLVAVHDRGQNDRVQSDHTAAGEGAG